MPFAVLAADFPLSYKVSALKARGWSRSLNAERPFSEQAQQFGCQAWLPHTPDPRRLRNDMQAILPRVVPAHKSSATLLALPTSHGFFVCDRAGECANDYAARTSVAGGNFEAN